MTGHPNLFLNTAGDIDLLPRVIDAAERFDGTKPADGEMEQLVAAHEMQPLFV